MTADKELFTRLALEAGFAPTLDSGLPCLSDSDEDASIGELLYVGEYPVGLDVFRLIALVADECAKAAEAVDLYDEDDPMKAAANAIRAKFGRST